MFSPVASGSIVGFMWWQGWEEEDVDMRRFCCDFAVYLSSAILYYCRPHPSLEELGHCSQWFGMGKKATATERRRAEAELAKVLFPFVEKSIDCPPACLHILYSAMDLLERFTHFTF